MRNQYKPVQKSFVKLKIKRFEMLMIPLCSIKFYLMTKQFSTVGKIWWIAWQCFGQQSKYKFAQEQLQLRHIQQECKFWIGLQDVTEISAMMIIIWLNLDSLNPQLFENIAYVVPLYLTSSSSSYQPYIFQRNSCVFVFLSGRGSAPISCMCYVACCHDELGWPVLVVVAVVLSCMEESN